MENVLIYIWRERTSIPTRILIIFNRKYLPVPIITNYTGSCPCLVQWKYVLLLWNICSLYEFDQRRKTTTRKGNTQPIWWDNNSSNNWYRKKLLSLNRFCVIIFLVFFYVLFHFLRKLICFSLDYFIIITYILYFRSYRETFNVCVSKEGRICKEKIWTWKRIILKVLF